MSTDIEPTVQFVNPVSGEILTLASPTPDLAEYLADLRDLESQLKEHKSLVNRELLARLDRDAKWTLRTGDWKVTAPSPEPGEEWSGAELYDALCEQVDRGVISMDAVNAAVEIQHVYKVRKAGVNALRKLSDGLRELVDSFSAPVEKARYVRVSRGD